MLKNEHRRDGLLRRFCYEISFKYWQISTNINKYKPMRKITNRWTGLPGRFCYAQTMRNLCAFTRKPCGDGDPQWQQPPIRLSWQMFSISLIGSTKSIEDATDMHTWSNLQNGISININEYQQISTNIIKYQQISIQILKYQHRSTNINKYELRANICA